MAKELETRVLISGQLDKALVKAIEESKQVLEKLQEATLKSGSAMDKLDSTAKAQESTLKALKRSYADVSLTQGESSDEAKDLANQIEKLSTELKDNKQKMKDAENAADKFDKTLNELEDSAKDVDGGFTVMKGTLSGLATVGITKALGAVKNMATSIFNLSESTQEYREDMGKLETAWQSAGKSTELATQTYKNFYAALGEEDRSVEAVNHLAKFVDNEKDMEKWTAICTGVWGTFGDSLPIEGLTEASNETAKVGKLTGVLADALNWAGVNEDDFQASLDACATEQERTALITDTLNGLYSEAAANYEKNNKSVMDARLAQSEYNDKLAELGELIEPVKTKITKGLTRILDKVLEVMKNVDTEALGETIDNITDKITGAIDFISEHHDLLLSIATAIGVVSAALGVLNVVLAVQSAIMAANPITWIVLGIVAALAALIAIGIKVWKNWDTIKAKGAAFINFIKNRFAAFPEEMGQILEQVKSRFTAGFASIRDGVANIVEGIKSKFKAGFSGLIGIVKGPINTIIGAVNKVISAINNAGFTVPDWVPGIGGKSFGVNISKIPMLARGGFTDGVSIAGEDGTEAVISFDPAYRSENIGYLARAARMLGVAVDTGNTLSSMSNNSVMYDMGGVVFSPQITVQGNANKTDIMDAIEEEYPEFIDMLERWFRDRGGAVYG